MTAPSPDGQVVSGLTTALHTAGATITGTVALQPAFFDDSDSTEAQLTQLAQQLAAAAGLTISAQHDGDAVAGQEAAAQVIAAAIATKTDPAALSRAQSQAILSGFASAGYLQVSAPGGTAASLPPAGLAIVVAPATPPSTTDVSPANLALLAVAEQLQTASHGAVLAGSLAGSGPGSAIDEATGAGKVSTVDEADSASGQIMTVQALSSLLAGHPPAQLRCAPGHRAQPRPHALGHPERDHDHDRPPCEKQMSRLPIRSAALAAAAARLSYAGLRRRPPGGAAAWSRTNHRGEPVTLLEGPAAALGGSRARCSRRAWPGGSAPPWSSPAPPRPPSAATTTWPAAGRAAASAATWARWPAAS